MVTLERLKEVLDYDPATGLFRWKVKRCNVEAGQVAGHHKGPRYIRINIDLVSYRAHILAWLYMTGEWPPRFIDHRDTDKANNRWENLRLATKSQNMANMPAPKSNRSGFKGVSRYRAGDSYGKPWQAGISKDGKRMSLGHFATPEEAHAAYAAAAEKFFGEFARAA